MVANCVANPRDERQALGQEMSQAPEQVDQDEQKQRGEVAVLSVDLFFGMRIRTVLRQLGYTVVLTKSAAEFQDRAESATLGLIDFNQPIAWDDLTQVIEHGLPVIAFGSHTDVAGFRAAKAAGVSRVVSNGEFNRSLPALAEKYARPA